MYFSIAKGRLVTETSGLPLEEANKVFKGYRPKNNRNCN
jgi:hypothetical protein